MNMRCETSSIHEKAKPGSRAWARLRIGIGVGVGVGVGVTVEGLRGEGLELGFGLGFEAGLGFGLGFEAGRPRRLQRVEGGAEGREHLR